MTVTPTAVFTFQDLKVDGKREYAKLYYPVTVFNRTTNKTITIEIPYHQYERVAEFIEDCLYTEETIDNHCKITGQPKSVQLLLQREFYKAQAKLLTNAGLSLNALFNELFFGGETNESRQNDGQIPPR